jgi:hypothetical protein
MLLNSILNYKILMYQFENRSTGVFVLFGLFAADRIIRYRLVLHMNSTFLSYSFGQPHMSNICLLAGAECGLSYGDSRSLVCSQNTYSSQLSNARLTHPQKKSSHAPKDRRITPFGLLMFTVLFIFCTIVTGAQSLTTLRNRLGGRASTAIIRPTVTPNHENGKGFVLDAAKPNQVGWLGIKRRANHATETKHLGVGEDTHTATTFTLAAPASVSQGVFHKATGALVRTLSSAEQLAAGTYSKADWDGKGDEGIALPEPPSAYEQRVQVARARATCLGTIGNSSASFTDYRWRALGTLQDLAPAPNGELVGAMGYNEQFAGLVYTPAGTVQAPRAVLPHNIAESFQLVRADAQYIYAASNNSGFDPHQSSFVVRVSTTTKQPVPWSAGESISSTIINGLYSRRGVLSVRQNAVATTSAAQHTTRRTAWLATRITGLAVSERYVAVARKTQNTVQLYSKVSGALLGTQAVEGVGSLAFAANGDLWAVSNGQVKRFEVRSNAALLKLATTLPGISEALALDAHPSQDLVLIALGGAKQQLQAYRADGTLQWTYGQKGGYLTNGPAVRYDKFWFAINNYLAYNATDSDQLGDPFAFVKWQSDGTFWVGDVANVRTLHFAANRRYLEQISYLPDRLFLAADAHNPTRVFSGMLEFQVTTGSLRPGDPSLASAPSWVLRNNWAAGLSNPKLYRYLNLRNVVTHANGHTYAQLPDNETRGGTYLSDLVELTASRGLRFTGIKTQTHGYQGVSLEQQADGSLRGWRINTATAPATYNASSTGLAQLYIEEQTLTGYDTNFTPQYGPIMQKASLLSTYRHGTDPFPSRSAGPQTYIRVPQTANGNYISYQPHTANWVNGWAFHLGAVQPGGTDWWAKFHHGSDATLNDGRGFYVESGAYGGLDGGNMDAVGKHIIAYYNGQSNSASNTIFHYSQDGLLIQQFGVSGFTIDQDRVPLGQAGNALDMVVNQLSSKVLRIYVPDEAYTSGIVCWQIDNADAVTILPMRK